MRSFEISGYKTSTSSKLNRPKTKKFDEIHSLYVNFKRSGFHRYPKLDELQVILTFLNKQAPYSLFFDMGSQIQDFPDFWPNLAAFMIQQAFSSHGQLKLPREHRCIQQLYIKIFWTK